MKKKKWMKRLLRILAFFSVSIIILGIIFNQLLFRLLIGVGSVDINYGNDARGNEIIVFALSNIKNPREKTYHAISVQNTKNGNYSVAIDALEKAYSLNPNEIGAYYGWVLLYYYHEYKKAINILQKYDDSTPNFSDYPMGECIHYLKGLAYKELGEYNLALKEFDLSIKYGLEQHGEDWVDYQIFLNRGITLLHLKRYQEAVEEFKRVIKNYNKCSEAYYFMGVALSKIDKTTDACNSFSQSLVLMEEGFKSYDPYVELFHAVYEEEILQAISKNCN